MKLKKWKDFINESNRIDQILDKISASGIESLTKDEKNYLDSMSSGKPYVPEVEPEENIINKPVSKLNDEDDFEDDDEDFEDEDNSDMEDEMEERDVEKQLQNSRNVVLIVCDITELDQPWHSQFMEDSGGSNFAVIAFDKAGNLIDKKVTDHFTLLKDCDLWDEVEGYMSYDPSGDWNEDELIDELEKIGFTVYSSNSEMGKKYLN